MTQTVVLDLAQKSLWLLMILSMPVLLLSLVVGIAISIFQAVTQINEMTLTFVPKLVIVFAALALLGPWMMTTTIDFVSQLLIQLPEYAR